MPERPQWPTTPAEVVSGLSQPEPSSGLPPPADGWEAMSDEEKRFEAQRKEQIIREKDEELEQAHDIHGLRKAYLCVSFVFVAVFALAAIAALALCGRHVIDLDTTVLVALLTTTMANIIGILAIAFKWLFPRK